MRYQDWTTGANQAFQIDRTRFLASKDHPVILLLINDQLIWW